MLPLWLVRLARKKALQPIYIRLDRVAKVGMNYWGGASVAESGERWALHHAAGLLKDVPLPVVFDVGAHYGEFTLAALACFQGKVHVNAFEPSPTARGIFRERVGAERDGRPVELHDFGFSSAQGADTLFAPTRGWSIASLHASGAEREGGSWQEEHIQLRTVDDLCREKGIERIHYLKVDTEGHEMAVLEGARGMIEAGKVDIVQFEFGERHLDSRVFFRDLYDLLSPRYTIHRILPQGLWPLRIYQPELEVFRTANYLAVSTSFRS